MRKDISPEERLLRLIKGHSGNKPAPSKKERSGPQGTKRLSLLKTPFSFVLKKTKSADIYNLKFFTQAAGLLLILSFSWLALSFFLPRDYKSSLVGPGPQIEATPVAGEPAEQPDFSSYAQEFKRRNLFRPMSRLSSKAEGLALIDPQELIRNLSLLGIISGENPQAIIEDKKARKTYFLNIGDSINGMILVSIKKGKVILEYQGQRFDLFL